MNRLMQFMAMAALTVWLSPAVKADTNSDLEQRLQALEQLVTQQQAEIARLRGDQQTVNTTVNRLEANMPLQATASNDLDSLSLSQVQNVGGVSIGKHVDNLQVTGGLRLRFQRQEVDPKGSGASADTEVFRHQYELGLVWQTNEGWEIGAGLASGSDGDHSSASAVNRNDTLSQFGAFERGNINIDYAYAKHSWDTGTSLTLGQQKNPFVSSWVVWDADVRPVGLVLQQDLDPAFLTIGAFEVEEAFVAGPTNSSRMVGAQLGAGYEGEGFDGTLAVGYYHFNEGPTQDALFTGSQYEVHILDVYGELGADLGGAAVTLMGQYVKNFGADGVVGAGQMGYSLDPDDEDQAWMIGVKGEASGFTACYAYAHIEADAIHGDLNDGDFGSGLGGQNVEGHKISLGYAFTKNFTLRGTALLAEELETRSAMSYDQDDLYQIDAVYKF